MVKTTVAMILINELLIPYLITPHNGPTIHIIVVNENMTEDDDDEYIEFEEGTPDSVPSDW
eukprot:CAMPEP_0201571724 /NCGR_PEP_ID=MMETSP0190_2-20130828/14649_1 /ASSEMBLY_ACC=CAM_ASM_000263 /TAXON_ID=37353 /ORGANISM="Rosalina sp." /LENGTH=60 /DNA_ID=CAMNT_0047996689 /DNA_START=172 /DNA_END=351 /DNA_ORIENTATION=+